MTNPGTPQDSGHETTARDVAGLGALGAAGLVALFGLLRLIQQRRRKPGHRIRQPKVVSDVETTMRADQDPASVELLDIALRSLAARGPGSRPVGSNFCCPVPAHEAASPRSPGPGRISGHWSGAVRPSFQPIRRGTTPPPTLPWSPWAMTWKARTSCWTSRRSVR
jgi:hypothetical protein